MPRRVPNYRTASIRFFLQPAATAGHSPTLAASLTREPPASREAPAVAAAAAAAIGGRRKAEAPDGITGADRVSRIIIIIIIIIGEMAVFNVAGHLIEERRGWPVITASPRLQYSK